ncbi:MAG TPA: EamA family transporter RarD [Gammaproteobacteria bacterium]|nr:EamA family transporter RarD [Gammaproteobacteria bacterium]
MASSVDEGGDSSREGIVAGLIAYTLWGFLPIYFKIVQDVAPLEVLAHRIVWAVPFGMPIVLARRQWPDVRRAFSDRRTLALLALSAVLIALNWLVYIWAVQSGRIFQGSLGYYINPLMNVLIGIAFFRERLRALQVAAVWLAAAGVAVLTLSGGQFPAIALTLATSFTLYGVIRKRAPIGAMPGLFVETLILFPFAAAYLAHLVLADSAAFGVDDPSAMGTLMLAGPFTVLPLLAFATAARRLRLSTLGIMQFISPTLQFAIGLAYGETLTRAHVFCFGLIWIAVAAFSFDAWRSARGAEPAAAAVARPARRAAGDRV